MVAENQIFYEEWLLTESEIYWAGPGRCLWGARRFGKGVAFWVGGEGGGGLLRGLSAWGEGVGSLCGFSLQQGEELNQLVELEDLAQQGVSCETL